MKMKLRVWWIPQVPGKPFVVEVDTVTEGVLVMDTLARYDMFQFENNIKPDYCNAGGLGMYENDEWVDWFDEETGIDDPEEYLEYLKELEV
jgi:hypothetical protein